MTSNPADNDASKGGVGAGSRHLPGGVARRSVDEHVLTLNLAFGYHHQMVEEQPLEIGEPGNADICLAIRMTDDTA